MKTTEYKELRRVMSRGCRSKDLYPTLGETKRLEKVYVDLGLDFSVLRPKDASPKKDKTRKKG